MLPDLPSSPSEPTDSTRTNKLPSLGVIVRCKQEARTDPFRRTRYNCLWQIGVVFFSVRLSS
jgi:hypothetical protein